MSVYNILLMFLLTAVQSDICVQSFTRLTVPNQRSSSLPPLFYTRGTTGPIIHNINSPSGLKEFVIADDRVAVIKVYAEWCKTCKQFDVRYRKVASIWGESNGIGEENEFSNLARFAQMEYGGEI